MKRYQKYIAGLYYSSFFKVLLFLTVIIICTKTLHYLQTVSQTAINGKSFLIALLAIAPYVIINIVPFASCVACIMIFYTMLSSSQVLIFQNAGLKRINIALIPLIFFIPIAVLLFFAEHFFIPKTFAITQEMQNSMFETQAQSISKPNTVQQIGNIVAITSGLNKNGTIEKTFIYRKSLTEELSFIGNIKESWAFNQFFGFWASNAYILQNNQYGISQTQFQNLEMQINLQEEHENVPLAKMNSLELLKIYTSSNNKHIQSEVIQTLNKRTTPVLLVLLLPFSIATLMVKYHSVRVGIKIQDTVKIILMAFYCLFSCYEVARMFDEIHNFYLIYINIFLTFLLLCFLNKQNFDFLKKYV